jgi:hypothetical protein
MERGYVMYPLMVVALTVITVASASNVKQEVGPYTVSFDLTNTSVEINSSASKWESYDGRSYAVEGNK